MRQKGSHVVLRGQSPSPTASAAPAAMAEDDADVDGSFSRAVHEACDASAEDELDDTHVQSSAHALLEDGRAGI